MIKIYSLVALTFLAGCAGTPAVQSCTPVEVKVPYRVNVPTYIDRTPPAELARGYAPLDFPEFTEPNDPATVVGMDKAALERLKIIIRTLKTRDNAWRAWASPKPEATP